MITLSSQECTGICTLSFLFRFREQLWKFSKVVQHPAGSAQRAMRWYLSRCWWVLVRHLMEIVQVVHESCHIPGTKLGPEAAGLEAHISTPSCPCLQKSHTLLVEELSHRWRYDLAEKNVVIESWISCGGNTEEKRFLLSWGTLEAFKEETTLGFS